MTASLRSPLLLSLCFAVFLTSACSLVYRLPTRQGNEIDQEKVQQLQLGMSREQVKFLMGTPLTINPFRENQWDYAWFYKSPRGEEARRIVSMTFTGDRLTDIQDNLAQASTEIDTYELESGTPDRVHDPAPSNTDGAKGNRTPGRQPGDY